MFKINKKEWNIFKNYFNTLNKNTKLTTHTLLKNTGLNIDTVRSIIIEAIMRKYLRVESRRGKPDIITKLRDMEEY